MHIVRKLGEATFREGEKTFHSHWFLATLDGQPTLGEKDTFDHFAYIALTHFSKQSLSPNMQNFLFALEEKTIHLEKQKRQE